MSIGTAHHLPAAAARLFVEQCEAVPFIGCPGRCPEHVAAGGIGNLKVLVGLQPSSACEFVTLVGRQRQS